MLLVNTYIVRHCGLNWTAAQKSAHQLDWISMLMFLGKCEISIGDMPEKIQYLKSGVQEQRAGGHKDILWKFHFNIKSVKNRAIPFSNKKITWCCSKSSLTTPNLLDPRRSLSMSCWAASILDLKPMPSNARSCPAGVKSPPSKKPGSSISPITSMPIQKHSFSYMLQCLDFLSRKQILLIGIRQGMAATLHVMHHMSGHSSWSLCCYSAQHLTVEVTPLNDWAPNLDWTEIMLD